MNKKKILLVDDDVNLRETINELLILEKFETRTAENGQIALDILDLWIPDLIICDIMMPVMDGETFQKIIYGNKNFSTIPFIFLTAMNEEGLIRKCFNEGADDFLTKPFKINELLKTIEIKIERFNKIKNSNNLYLGEKKYFCHEINTPLNGILESIDLLINNSDNFEQSEINDFYEAIKISGERLYRNTQNIVLLEEIKNNKIELFNIDISEIKGVFRNVLGKILLNYKKQENRIVSKLRTSKLEISEKNLSFILFELLDNALKFSPKNKKVIIEGSRYDDNLYEIRIFDSGIGFKEEELQIIDAGVQFHRDKYEQQGLGLGLYLSKLIVKQSDGLMSIFSKENEGTKISILLPIHKKLF
ncbi:hybrid sensor histidine kinase/response regulator [Flavobacterium alvei]|uniref:histidine kinase n=1 Tax=Flavobacterium alvei TaxID=2080416 RepID=A0A2S5AFT5_9FLAO|nr:response regulator [Flavobacterium alvei]POY41428.1 hybrid sensor histidine kinase/response regulator [Flavobacterium alvei]